MVYQPPDEHSTVPSLEKSRLRLPFSHFVPLSSEFSFCTTLPNGPVLLHDSMYQIKLGSAAGSQSEAVTVSGIGLLASCAAILITSPPVQAGCPISSPQNHIPTWEKKDEERHIASLEGHSL